MRKRVGTLVLLLTALSLMSVSYAQEPEIKPAAIGTTQEYMGGSADAVLDGVEESDARGVRITPGGNSRFHMNLDFGIGANSNPYGLPASDPNGTNWNFAVKLRPGFHLTAKNRQTILETGLALDWVIFAPFNNFNNFTYNNLAGLVFGRGEFNRDGAVSLRMKGELETGQQITELFVGVKTNVRAYGEVGSTIRPIGGAFSVEVDGQIDDSFYPPNFLGLFNPESYGNIDTLAYYAHLRPSWKFLPKTALFIDGKGGYTTNSINQTNGISSNPLWISAGLTGQVTSRLSGLLSVGYGQVLLAGPGSVSLPRTSFPMIGALELKWRIGEGTKLSGALRRDVAPVAIFLDTYSNGLSLDLLQNFGRVATLSIAPQIAVLQFGLPSAFRTTGQSNRNDVQVVERTQLMFHATDWLDLGAIHESTVRWTNSDPNNITTPAGYYALPANTLTYLLQKHEIYAALSIHY